MQRNFEPPISAIAIVYDGDGDRVSETVGGTTTKFLVDDHNPTGLAQVLDEIVGGSVTRTYAYGWQRISENQLISGTWTPSLYGYDGHGNVRFLANTAGTVTDTCDYDAFGNQITSAGTTPNNFLYSGEQFNISTGLYYLRARYYRDATGRLLTMDPYEGTILNPRTLHKYAYTGNDPINFVDPTGRVFDTAAIYFKIAAAAVVLQSLAIAICESLEPVAEKVEGVDPDLTNPPPTPIITAPHLPIRSIGPPHRNICVPLVSLDAWAFGSQCGIGFCRRKG